MPLILVIAVVATFVAYRASSGATVDVVRPTWGTVAETVATSGSVEGHSETVVGADAQGTVAQLYVDENAIVHKGELLAVVQPRSAQSQFEQAIAAETRAEAQLRQAKVGALPQEIRGAIAKLQDATAAGGHARIAVDRATLSTQSSVVAVHRAEAALARARAADTEANSRRDLAEKTLRRTRALVVEGALPAARLDEDKSAFDVAVAACTDAAEAVRVATDDLAQARLDQTNSTQARRQAADDLASARAQRSAAQAELDRLRSLPRPEDVEVARAQLAEARSAVKTARSATRNTEIRAPYDGIVTEILARPGSLVTSGVLHLVDSVHLEVKADVDESNLPLLSVGERVMLESSSAPDKPVDGRLIRLSSRVDASKGTVQVVAIPDAGSTSLRPGQRVDLIIVVDPHARRLLLPSSCVRRQADLTTVLLVVDGRAKARSVETGLASDGSVSILSGLEPSDVVVRDPGTIEAGARVQAKR